MEIIISPEKMKDLLKTCDDTVKTFVSNTNDKKILTAIEIIELMGGKKIEIDLSEDDKNLLH